MIDEGHDGKKGKRPKEKSNHGGVKEVMDIDRLCTQRILEGVAKYKKSVNPLNDSRCFLREFTEEMFDGLNYLKWAYQRGQLSEENFTLINRAIRLIIGLVEGSCVGNRLTEEGR